MHLAALAIDITNERGPSSEARRELAKKQDNVALIFSLSSKRLPAVATHYTTSRSV